MNRSQYELYHYGVKGMKWGVRKNPTNKSVRKKKKLTENEKNARDAAIYAALTGMSATTISSFLAKRVTTIDPIYIAIGSAAVGANVAIKNYVDTFEEYETGKSDRLFYK